MIIQLRRAAAIVRQHVSLVASSPDGRRLVRGTLRAARAVAVDASLVALLAGVVAFAATRPTGAAPKAWYYAGGGQGGYGLADEGLPVAWGCVDPYGSELSLGTTVGQGPFVRIAAGWGHAVALRRDGTLAAWGGGGVASSVPSPGELVPGDSSRLGCAEPRMGISACPVARSSSLRRPRLFA